MRRLLPFVAVVALVTAVYFAGGFEPLERHLIDARFRLIDRKAEGGLVVVAVDPKSLRTLDVWPWARGYHATVLENLLETGARRVAFDLDFSSRSIPEEDLELENALAGSRGRVILPLFQQRERISSGGARLSLTEPLQAFRRHATLGTINVRPEPDGLVRRYRIVEELDGATVPSLALALADPLDPGFDSFYLDFSIAPESIPRISYVDVLTGQFDPELVRGKAVIIGSTAVELGDQVAVPLLASLPGAVLQALAYESLAQGRVLHRTGPIFTAAVVLLLGLLTGPLLQAASWRAGLILASTMTAAVFLLAVAAQSHAPVLIDISPWIVILLGNFGFAMVRRIDQQSLRLLLQALKIRRTETLMRHVVDNSFDAIVTVDQDGLIETINPAAESMFGCSAGEITGRHIGELACPRDAAPASFAQYGSFEVSQPHEAVGRRSDGTTFPIELAIGEIEGDESGRRVCFLRDITERKAHEQALKHQATHDALTRLPNRVLLRRRVEEALRAAESDGSPVAFMIVDLDRFKEINDTLGHHVGDLLLQQLGERLLRPLRDSDTIARFGGDEFAVLLPRTRLAAAREMARELIGTLAEPFNLYGLALQVDASVGIAMFPVHGTGPTELIQRADVAMYMAKRTRTEVAVYHADHDFTSVRHLTLSGELRKAIEEDHLTLYYQPKIACDTGRLVGVEALVRWWHPQHGLLPPAEFIIVAEHSGLIKSLSQWVLDAALRQCAEWHRQGLPIAVSVNVSARNLQEEELPQQLARLLKDLQISPDLLTLEITESVIMENPQRAMAVLTEFSKLGVRISIDDFGTGYSSLAYLKRLPASEIKIDRAFVAKIDHDREDAVIVRSTIEMAHNLGLKVVAEGIENERVWKTLKAFGCNFGQGYFFSPPLAADSFIEWLRASPWKPGSDSEDNRQHDFSVA